MPVSGDSPNPMLSDVQIASKVQLRDITDVASSGLGLAHDVLTTYGRHKAKIDYHRVTSSGDFESGVGKIVLMTGVSPTPAGEGKTTTTLGLNDALNRLGVRSTACLREPSLGPVFGMKGGAHGGGRAQVVPMIDINLHFTGDIHAVTAANNLLSSLLDNHFYWGNKLDIDPGQVYWRRVMDISDRALRSLNLRLSKCLTRPEGFNITAASEVMAVLCLAEDLTDLERRIGKIVVGLSCDGRPVTAADLDAVGAMVVLLKDAFNPNLVQSLEGNAVFIHGGPFANIAHGCNSVVATRTAMKLSDVVVIEAGFGSDLGGEKFFNIKCRASGLHASACVIVCTVRSTKMQGGVPREELLVPHPECVAKGTLNLKRHIEIIRQFGLEPVVSVNRFDGDTDEEIELVREAAEQEGVACCVATHWRDGGEGAMSLAETVLTALARNSGKSRLLYPNSLSLKDKVATIAKKIYGAEGVDYHPVALNRLENLEALGFGELPVCIAKTQYSFSADPKALGAAEGHVLPVREIRLNAGAGFVVVVTGAMMTMPGLPRHPASVGVSLQPDGTVAGI